MFPIVELIDELESALKTPVQATVKREDEQAFTRLNGSNLMFCEDAGRRIQTALNGDERILDFWARCTHYESLHPHNAVSVVTKGVEGGYVAGAGAPCAWSASAMITVGPNIVRDIGARIANPIIANKVRSYGSACGSPSSNSCGSTRRSSQFMRQSR
jgi:hypothetical protein